MTAFTQNKFDSHADHAKGALSKGQNVLQIPVIVGANGTYKAGQFVKATGVKNGKVVVAPITSASDVAFGVLSNNIGRDDDVALVVDDLIEVVDLLDSETIIVEAGGAIAINVGVEVSANGEKVVTTGGTNKVVGFTREIAGADGDLIEIRLFKEI